MQYVERILVGTVLALYITREIWLAVNYQWGQILRDCFMVGAVALISFVFILKHRSAIRRSGERTRQILQRGRK